MSHVALLGFGPSLALRDTLPGDVEIWSLNWAWKHGIDPDRLFELHDPVMLARMAALGSELEREHLQWLMQQYHGISIYTLHPVHYPLRVPYPLEEVTKDLFPFGKPYLTSTFSYMLALAIHEKHEKIYIYGFEMVKESEYGYQKPGAEYLIGVAQGRGIEIVLPEHTDLLKASLYGMGGQAIGRQSLEHALQSYQQMQQKALDDLNVIKGAIKAITQLLRVVDDEN